MTRRMSWTNLQARPPQTQTKTQTQRPCRLECAHTDCHLMPRYPRTHRNPSESTESTESMDQIHRLDTSGPQNYKFGSLEVY
mmetsp:Transcript_28916/g.46220  ORF Transcript_28916/g.46220 Transcript_28916/m.46220 type:complete len:82 (+) Transcript_28916:827-1072(+)